MTMPAPPIPVQNALRNFGSAIWAARIRRRLPRQLLAEGVLISRSTLARVEAGDPRVCLATYATILHELGIGERLARLADASSDRIGLRVAEEQRLPKRVQLSRRKVSRVGLKIGALRYKELVANRQNSRDTDEALLKSGAISRNELQRRNSMVRAGALQHESCRCPTIALNRIEKSSTRWLG
jgi:transcriptional regulator with XRE-family HTH domain